MSDPPQHEWPELKGKTYEEAAKFLAENHPDLEPVRVPEGSPVTRDFRIERVRIFVNLDGIIVEVPRTG